MNSYSVPRVEQLSVFLENRSGCLSAALNILALANVNIRALSLADTSDFGILRMITSDNFLAEKALKENGFTTGHTDVLIVELRDEPGSLDKVLKILSALDINVEYMYASARSSLDRAPMVFRFDRIDAAIEALEETGYKLLTQV